MLNTGQNEVTKFVGSRFKKNQTLSTRVCINQRDNAKLKSSDSEKAQFTIFRQQIAHFIRSRNFILYSIFRSSYYNFLSIA